MQNIDNLQPQTVYIIINNVGIPLGVYRDYKTATHAVQIYIKNSTLNEPNVSIWKFSSTQVNKPPKNRFECMISFDNTI